MGVLVCEIEHLLDVLGRKACPRARTYEQRREPERPERRLGMGIAGQEVIAPCERPRVLREVFGDRLRLEAERPLVSRGESSVESGIERMGQWSMPSGVATTGRSVSPHAEDHTTSYAWSSCSAQAPAPDEPLQSQDAATISWRV